MVESNYQTTNLSVEVSASSLLNILYSSPIWPRLMIKVSEFGMNQYIMDNYRYY